MAPKIRFFSGASEQRIAYAVDGEGPPLVCPAWWVSHVERDWESQSFRRFFSALARDSTVVRYDRPGVGLSDRQRDAFELVQEVSDLEVLADRLELEQFALLGISCGGPVAVTYAHRHPQRVTQLILYGTFADGSMLAPGGVQQALVALVRAHWGLGSRTLADLLAPELTREELKHFGAEQRAAASAEMAAQLLELTFRMDVREIAEEIQVPTRVLHRRGDRTIQFEAGRELASRIPGAILAPLSGKAHVPWHEDDREMLAAIGEALGARDWPVQDSFVETSFRLDREGELWHVSFAGRSARIRHTKGLADLAMLWARPGQEIPAVNLFAGPDKPPPVTSAPDQVLDDRARAEYRARLAAIEEALEEAESWNDVGRAERLREERQALLVELRTATGLGGRRRRFADPAERARKAVTARIRDAIRKIRDAHPELAAHLENSVSTGTLCSYTPVETKDPR